MAHALDKTHLFDFILLCFSEAFREAKAELGGLNVVCNNAGIACPTAERTRWEKFLLLTWYIKLVFIRIANRAVSPVDVVKKHTVIAVVNDMKKNCLRHL